MKNEIDISPRQIANAIDNLLDERNELQERIDKAIELMYNKATFNLNDKYGKVFLDLLEILGGDVDDE